MNNFNYDTYVSLVIHVHMQRFVRYRSINKFSVYAMVSDNLSFNFGELFLAVHFAMDFNDMYKGLKYTRLKCFDIFNNRLHSFIFT